MKKKVIKIAKPPMTLGQYIDWALAEHRLEPMKADMTEYGLSSQGEEKLPKRAVETLVKMNKSFCAVPSWQATAAFILVLQCGADSDGELASPTSDSYWERIEQASEAASCMTDRTYMMGLDLVSKRN